MLFRKFEQVRRTCVLHVARGGSILPAKNHLQSRHRRAIAKAELSATSMSRRSEFHLADILHEPSSNRAMLGLRQFTDPLSALARSLIPNSIPFQVCRDPLRYTYYTRLSTSARPRPSSCVGYAAHIPFAAISKTYAHVFCRSGKNPPRNDTAFLAWNRCVGS